MQRKRNRVCTETPCPWRKIKSVADYHSFIFTLSCLGLYWVSQKKRVLTNDVPSFPVLKKDVNATTFSYQLPKTQVHLIRSLWSYDFKRRLRHETNFRTFHNIWLFVYGQSTTQQKVYKNGPASKFTFEVISWKLFYENHSCLIMMGKWCGNWICKRGNFV